MVTSILIKVIFEIIQWIQVNVRILFIYCISLTRFSKLKAPRLKRKCVCRPDLKTSSVSGDMMNCNQVQAYFASRSDKKNRVSLFQVLSLFSSEFRSFRSSFCTLNPQKPQVPRRYLKNLAFLTIYGKPLFLAKTLRQKSKKNLMKNSA